jgi:hypothetical protein
MMQSGKTNVAECFNLIRNPTETVNNITKLGSFRYGHFNLRHLTAVVVKAAN